MDCAGMTDRVWGYHFGTLDPPSTDEVEAHLLTCTACLRAYLALRRATLEAPSERPSGEARARLRAAVAARYAPQATIEGTARTTPSARPRFFARRIPLYQGLAFAAIAAAVVLSLQGAVRLAERRVGAGAPDIDTSRPRANSLRIY